MPTRITPGIKPTRTIASESLPHTPPKGEPAAAPGRSTGWSPANKLVRAGKAQGPQTSTKVK